MSALLLYLSTSFAQKHIDHMNIIPKVGKETLELYKKYKIDNDSVEIHSLKFYISNIQFFKGPVSVESSVKKHHLFDSENPDSYTIPLQDDILFDNISFDLGIDSLTNTSGVLGGDLDPTNSMYWTWQSGYINFKIEGTSSASTSRNKTFTFHLGGYSAPYNAIKKIYLQAVNDHDLDITFDITSFIQSIDMPSCSEVMSPGTKAMSISQCAARAFKLYPR